MEMSSLRGRENREFLLTRILFWVFVAGFFGFFADIIVRLYLYNMYTNAVTYASDNNVPLSTILPSWINSLMFYHTWFLIPFFGFVMVIGGLIYVKYS